MITDMDPHPAQVLVKLPAIVFLHRSGICPFETISVSSMYFRHITMIISCIIPVFRDFEKVEKGGKNIN